MKRISSINRKWYIYISIWVFYAQIHCLWHREASLGVSYEGRKTLIRQVLLCKQSISLNDPIVASAKFFFLVPFIPEHSLSEREESVLYFKCLPSRRGMWKAHSRETGWGQAGLLVSHQRWTPLPGSDFSGTRRVLKIQGCLAGAWVKWNTVSSRCWISDLTATQDHTTKCNRSCGNLPEDSV